MKYCALVLCIFASIGCDDSTDGSDTGSETVSDADIDLGGSNAVIVSARGTVTGSTTTAVIGASGGTLATADGALSITIPQGALDADTTVSITPITNTAPLASGPAFRLEPEGTTFAQAVTLAFTYSDADVASSAADFLWIVTQNDDGSWTPSLDSAVDTSAKTVTVAATHFSDWAAARFLDLTLNPVATTVSVNQQVNVGLTGFETFEQKLARFDALVTDDALGLDILAPLPESTVQKFRVTGWTLNGTTAPTQGASGSLIVGVARAIYIAPGKVPSANPVAVTVQLEGQGTTLKSYSVTSNIFVEDETGAMTLTYDGEKYTYSDVSDPSAFSDGVYHYAEAYYANDSLSLTASYNDIDAMTQIATLESSIAAPVSGDNILYCIYNEDADHPASYVKFTPTVESTISAQTDWLDYTPLSDDACGLSYYCTQMTVTLTDFDTTAGTVKGTINGKLRDYDYGPSPACETPAEHTLSGTFTLDLGQR